MMEIVRLGSTELTQEQKKEFFDISMESAVKLMNTFNDWEWNRGMSINAMAWVMSALIADEAIDEEDLRDIFIGIKSNAKILEKEE